VKYLFFSSIRFEFSDAEVVGDISEIYSIFLIYFLLKIFRSFLQLPKDTQTALTTKLNESFQPKSAVDYCSWLNPYIEEGQTIKAFAERTSKADRIESERPFFCFLYTSHSNL
jgi:hypothetical protein